MSSSTALVAVVGGSVYEAYAEALMESAREFFHPTPQVEYLILDGEEGWPNGTMMRYHRLLQERIGTDWLYLVDADMLCVAPIDNEILPPEEFAIVLTQHPGYVGRPPEELPFEDREASACYVPPEKRASYWCGGFVGGDRMEVLDLARMVVKRIDEDLANGITPRWHDESALNCAVTHWIGPRFHLSPSYCYPADPSWYKTFWTSDYQPKILALDKTAAERGDR